MNSDIIYCSYSVYIYQGAYDLPKMAKEHETEFHVNPNYVISELISITQMAIQPHKVQTNLPTIKEKKGLKHELTNSVIAMSH